MVKATRVKKGLLIKAYFLETFETKLYSKMFALILLKARLQTDVHVKTPVVVGEVQVSVRSCPHWQPQ